MDLDAKWNDLIGQIKEFNQLVVNCQQVNSTLLPIGEGVTIIIKK